MSDGHSTALSGNGSDPAIDRIREEPTNPHIFRGFGPLVVGLVLFLMMTWLAPTVAREGVTVQPKATTTTTTTTTSTTVAGGGM